MLAYLYNVLTFLLPYYPTTTVTYCCSFLFSNKSYTMKDSYNSMTIILKLQNLGVTQISFLCQ